MIEKIYNLPFSFVIDLHSIKNQAESRGDNTTISNLMGCYPWLFSKEFDDFIEEVKITARYLDTKFECGLH